MGKLPDVGTLQYELTVKYGAKRALKRVEIKYATKADGSDPNRYITYVAGIREDGQLWKLTEEEVIRSIKRNVSFYVTVNGRQFHVIVSKRNRREYIKTTADRYTPDHILGLPECP